MGDNGRGVLRLSGTTYGSFVREFAIKNLHVHEWTENWDIEVSRVGSFPVYQLYTVPGSWQTTFVPTTICWEPDLRSHEAEEGSWRLERWRSCSSEPFKLSERCPDCLLYSDQCLGHGAYNDLFRGTQDDTGPIMLTASHLSGKRRPRSLSVPPPIGRRLAAENSRADYVLEFHTWLPNRHYCLLGSRWKLSFNEWGARACLKGECDMSRSIQDSWQWRFRRAEDLERAERNSMS